MKPEFKLVQVGVDTFVMRNPSSKLTNRMCNSTLFEIKKDANLDVSVFEYFRVPIRIIDDAKLDFRYKSAKWLVAKYGYFSASFLPEISKRFKNQIVYRNSKGSFHENRKGN